MRTLILFRIVFSHLGLRSVVRTPHVFDTGSSGVSRVFVAVARSSKSTKPTTMME